MKIAFFSNFLNHHQVPLSDELFRITNGEYHFVETEPIPESFKRSGYPTYNKPYYIKAWGSKTSEENAKRLAKDADVAIFSTATICKYGKERLLGKKLTFEYSERWLKKGYLNLLSPNLIKHQLFYYLTGRKAQLYMLCSSAYAVNDYYLMNSYEDRCFKWGYFTEFKEIDIDSVICQHDNNIVKLMWCARFVDWKHPELPILMAKKMKEKGYVFCLDMYGTGEYLEQSKKLASDIGVLDVVRFCGNIPNAKILESMRQHDIFIFSSDRNEGWGAVANEAMSNGCVLVGSSAIGSIPFLIKDGINGLVFNSSNSGFFKNGMKIDERALFSLCDKVEFLLKNRAERIKLAKNAYETIKNLWSPKVAAKNFIQLVDDLQSGKDVSIATGPCSKAFPTK